MSEVYSKQKGMNCFETEWLLVNRMVLNTFLPPVETLELTFRLVNLRSENSN